MIVPEKTPDEIIAEKIECSRDELYKNERYIGLSQHLINYRKSNKSWDEYADMRMEPKARDLLKRILRECRRNGFIGCFVGIRRGENKIMFGRIVQAKQRNVPLKLKADLCTLCERQCSLKDSRGVMLDGAIRCWEREGK